MSQAVLLKEYKALAREKWVQIDIDEDNIYHWNLALLVLNPDSLYYGGYFKAQMNFPKDYPYKPPDFRFLKPLWHPNIYPDGRLCISILHAPGEDMMSGESAGERWSPAQRVESVLISILSLLDDAEISSPANVDASVMLRDEKESFKARVLQDVKASKKDIPEGFIMPTHESTKPVIEKIDDNFWNDSDAEEVDFDDFDDFDDDAANGSESDEALNNDSEDEENYDDDEEDTRHTTKGKSRSSRLDSEMTEPED
ncbi:Ubiquitin-conjugating enzyme subunit [Elasticomyces elasticus]|uniref:Ubiquitin-conjugating enzyme E2 2 n=1 Tax=Exophiala sideris TaxID=1016849 RepID=A0ABR0JE95_9EURO|nr:Ubiquitin-conjugating enzyme subunit [Elasticomyces elasticus]KAK5032643.1 Ubiquitin-conjugating enzyme subunit [Exophiala sideris]KAK5037176.1 Ubiquitin-conjugating enzyme subunit [Exophiala sideris]KAK5062168.1 Ubiquitin-conjugating enzyme subunit [Exophiala sideris]KAK5182334.1 Ubiquitin-conjugating enzyme subunit [Eurotiomycetes sp. CCFEE 6388]